jgi:uncharacterized protein YndB with AHSA1/START domain
MATPQPQPQHSLQLTRTFAAPRDRVYRAWTDAREFAQWFHPTADYKTVITRLDLRVGGKYSLEMHHKEGNIHRLSGTYEEIKPPEKLVFTWSWNQEEVAPGESLVTVTFKELGGSTEVTLTHKNLLTAESRDKHKEGWQGCLGQFERYLG